METGRRGLGARFGFARLSVAANSLVDCDPGFSLDTECLLDVLRGLCDDGDDDDAAAAASDRDLGADTRGVDGVTSWTSSPLSSISHTGVACSVFLRLAGEGCDKLGLYFGMVAGL